MTDELLIHNIGQLLTLAGPERARVGGEMADLGMVPDAAVLIVDGMIQSAGPAAEVASSASAGCPRFDARGCVVLPGFVDPHTHPVFAGTREDEYEMRARGLTYQQIAAAGGGILSTVEKTRRATEHELLALSLPRVQWFLEYGTTTIEAKSGYGLTLEDELKILRVIRRLNETTPLDLVPTFLGAHEFPGEYRGSPDLRNEYLDIVCDQMLPAVAAEGLARFCDVFCESHVFSTEESRRVLSRAAELGLGQRLHAEQLSSFGGAQVAARQKAHSADHLEHASESDIRALAEAGVIGILLPGAVFNLGLTRYAPARAMIDAGVAIALATDFNPGSSPTPSMQMVLSIACTQMRMTPAEAITAATVNAAYSLDLGGRIGSLEQGKHADLIICDCPDYRQIPYFFGVNHASVVIKRGRIVSDRRPPAGG